MTDRAAAAGARLRARLPAAPAARALLTRPTTTRSADLLQRWSGPGLDADRATSPRPSAATASAARIPQAAHCALEYHRWAARSQLRPDGLRYARRMAAPVTAPTLQLHGALDPCVLPRTARGLRAATSPGAYEWRELPGVGHFPQEEAPDAVTAAIAALGRRTDA